MTNKRLVKGKYQTTNGGQKIFIHLLKKRLTVAYDFSSRCLTDQNQGVELLIFSENSTPWKNRCL